MKRILIWTLIATFTVGGFIWIMWPVETWRLYDSLWQPLAMTQAENYCAGKVFAESGFVNKPNDPLVDQCVAESDKDNVTPNIAKSTRWACEGIGSVTADYAIEVCLIDIENFGVWFLQHGGYTWEWGPGHERPIAAHTDIVNAPRGERGGSDRNEGSRFGE